MPEPLLWALLAAAAAAALLGWRAARRRRQAVERLFADEAPGGIAGPAPEEDDAPPPPLLVPERPLAPWAVGAGAGLVLWGPLGLVPELAVALAMTVAVLAAIGLSFLRSRRVARLEEELADAIDLMVGSLRAGLGVLDALGEAAKECRGELRHELEAVIGRIRYGDDPRRAFLDLGERIQLETFELFGTALAIHWETGGSLATTLSSVGKAIRDRVEVARQVRTESTQARASIIVILFSSYLIALIAWRSDPLRMEMFLSSGLGAGMAAGAIALQAAGLFWLYRISRIRL